MKTLIVYATQHGCTEKCALALQEKLTGQTILCRINKSTVKPPKLDNFERIVIGGSIHVGKIQKSLQVFLADHEQQLLSKPYGLFLCCMHNGQAATDQFNSAFPDKIRAKAVAQGIFGGEFNFERMNFFEKVITRKVAHINVTQSNIDHSEINRFANLMNRSQQNQAIETNTSV